MKRVITAFLGKLKWGKTACAVFALWAAMAAALSAQTVTTLHSFDGTDGANPAAGLVLATNGDLYGTTFNGGANADGAIFKITPSGALTTLYSFCSKRSCMDGSHPVGTLVQATNGDFYGTTYSGGANNNCDVFGVVSSGCGTVFRISPSGTLTTLYSFCPQSGCIDGELPYAGLVQATNGDLYGTTSGGGANVYYGTVFKITPSGALTTLYSFCSQSGCTDGYEPLAGLVQASNGNLYGTTPYGGAEGGGTVFKITPSGKLTIRYNFCSKNECTDGRYPTAGLIQATNGDLYGTTVYGGRHGGPFAGGTVFRISPSGTLTTLYSFCSQSGCTDGELPEAGLVQATNGDFYGTTFNGGANDNAACSSSGTTGCGTIFEITPTGTLTTLYSFCSQSGCTDGYNVAQAALTQDTTGTFYGATNDGGANGAGTVFNLSIGLGPFVETQTTSGKLGAAVKILGSDLTGATSVSFNGTAATFTVVSRYLITTTVPAGATTGKVEVLTPSRTLSSNVPFRVLP